MTELPTRPDAATLRRLAYGTTIRPHSGIPSAVSQLQILENAARWHPSWRAAAIYEHRRPRRQPTPCVEAILVIAHYTPRTRTTPARTDWLTATLARWPLESR